MNAPAVTASSAPNVIAANRMAVTMQNTDVTIAFGQTRQAYDQNGEHVATATEYPVAVSLSPATAKQLFLILQGSIQQFEKRWGTIPLDPEFNQLVESKIKATESTPQKS